MLNYQRVKRTGFQPGDPSNHLYPFMVGNLSGQIKQTSCYFKRFPHPAETGTLWYHIGGWMSHEHGLMVVIRWYSNQYVYFCVYTELALGQWKEESWWTTGWSWISTGWKRATNFHPIQQGARCFLVPRCSRMFQVMMSFPMLDTFKYHPYSTHKHHPKNIQEPREPRFFLACRGARKMGVSWPLTSGISSTSRRHMTQHLRLMIG